MRGFHGARTAPGDDERAVVGELPRQLGYLSMPGVSRAMS